MGSSDCWKWLLLCALIMAGCSPTSSQRRSSSGEGTTEFDPSLVDETGGTADTGVDGGTDGSATGGTDDVGSSDETGTGGSGPICFPGVAECVDDTTRQICSETGGEWFPEACEGAKKCFEGLCSDVTCTPGHKLPECAGPVSFLVCNGVGTHYLPAPCKGGLFCFEGDCVDYECQPDSISCIGFGSVQQCAPDGSGWEIIEACEKGGTCFDGTCITACDVNLKAATYSGCEYFAVDLDNIEGGQFEPVALVVSVPSSVENSEVEIIDNSTGHTFTAAELNATGLVVPSGTLAVFELPLGGDLDGSSLSARSYRITTSAPATVHQFNPLNGSEVFTNDASLLLPSQAGGTEYYVMSWPMRKDEFETLRGFATIVATQPGETTVLVTPRSEVIAAADGSGVNTITIGATVSFTLLEGEVLNLETAGEQGADLTGTRIQADQQLAVFGGHECANVPLGINACDHLEQQLVPVEAWGKRYIADAFEPRSSEQFDIYRVMAGATDVLVETNPPVPGYEQFLLQPGSYVTFQSKKHFEVKATGRVLVGHYMIGSSYPGHEQTCKKTGIGDPAFTLSVPTQQFLKEYTVLTPPGYAENYINIIAPAGAQVMVDGQPLLTPLKQVAPGHDWAVAQHPVEGDKVHTVTAKKKFGLTAYGYDCDVSYAYPGGLRLLSLDAGGQ